MTEPPSLNLPSMNTTPDGFRTTVLYRERELNVSISLDGCPRESTLGLANHVTAHIASLDDKCKGLIAADSLASYNEGWRMGERLLPDGSTIPFENPELEEREFCERLELTALEITGDQTVTFWYDCGDLFWGHSIYVTSFDGLGFEDTSVEMFG